MPLTREITLETQHLFDRLYRQSCHYRVHQRTHCLWLQSQGLKTKVWRAIFLATEKMLYNWFNACDERGLVGLYDRPGRGRHAKLTDEQKAQVKRWVEAFSRQMNDPNSMSGLNKASKYSKKPNAFGFLRVT